ncbi:glycosyltransferase family 2 protein [Photobacterium leiognathi]|uniref:glycosyltransferase family 2 protein n=1 Tax=Photobacterium leiognathi TaxID=553611 RepID=UPI002982B4A6|nr:glycosyltransferase family 2 protein [Photobacterium leiognathi]
MSIKLVSVIMPAYNSESTIFNSIKSVLNQTHKNIELIITNDNSDDNTVSVIEKLLRIDNRIKLYSNSYCPGAANARNNSIRHASGDYIAFLDSDDQWFPTKLETQLKAMEDSECLASHSSYYRVDEKRNKRTLVTSKHKVKHEDMLHYNHIGNLTGIYNCKELGKFYQKNIGHEDYEMWLSILNKTDSIGILEPLASYNVSGDSLSSNKFKTALWHYNILRNKCGLNRFNASRYFFYYMNNAIKVRCNK